MEKLPIHTGDGPGGSLQPRWTQPRRCKCRLWRRLLVATCLVIGLYVVSRPLSLECVWPVYAPASVANHMPVEYHPRQLKQCPTVHSEDGPKRIPLEAHIMSKCPDAQECLQDLVLPAMEQISDKVDFRLSFIADATQDSSEIECKHGPAECIGDMLMLCAANLPFPPTADESMLPLTYPRTPIIRSLGFSNCLINDYERIPEREFVHQCAMEHGIDFDALNRCASQQNDDPGDGPDGKPPISGLALLREDALRGSKLGVKISCTVRLDDAVWCVRDMGEWKDCAQDGQGAKPPVLVDEIKRLWDGRN